MPAPASRRRAALVVALAASAACSGDQFVDPGSAPASRAFGLWNPGPFDSCTKEQHDAYAVLGPDGKVYPTWHPPTGPGGCSFGHEHGRDPSGSDLYDDTGDLPFGVANEHARHLRSREPPGRGPLRPQGRVGERHRAGVPGRRVGHLHGDLRRVHQVPPGHPLEGRVHQQRPRAGLSHPLRQRCPARHHDAHRDRAPGRVRPFLRPRGPRPGRRADPGEFAEGRRVPRDPRPDLRRAASAGARGPGLRLRRAARDLGDVEPGPDARTVTCWLTSIRTSRCACRAGSTIPPWPR